MSSSWIRIASFTLVTLAGALAPAVAANAFETFKALYEKKLTQLESDHEGSVFKLEALYTNKLDSLLDAATAAGDLDGALAIRKAKEQPTSQLPAGAPRELTAAHKIFQASFETRVSEHLSTVATVKSNYVKRLETMEVEHTRSGDLDTAVAIRKERESTKLSEAELAALDPAKGTSKPRSDFFEPRRPEFPLADLAPIRQAKSRPLELGTPEHGSSWKVIPPELAGGAARIYDGGFKKHDGVAEFEVLESGFICAIGSWGYQGNNSGGWVEERWKPEDFKKNGWKTLKEKLVRHKGSNYDVFYKHHDAGERVRVRVNKYTPPLLICRVGDGSEPVATLTKDGNPAPANTGNEPGSTIAPPSAPSATIPVKGTINQIKALLVQQLPAGGMAGFAQPLTITAVEDGGSEPMAVRFNQKVGDSMETALRAVVRGLQVKYGAWPRGFTAQLGFEEKYIPKDGPSAAVACALLIDGLVHDTAYDPGFAVTGDLNSDLSVQPVGGVPAKIRGASKRGAKIVAVPAANRRALEDLVALGELAAFADIQVFTIDDFAGAHDLAITERPADLQAAIDRFAELQRSGLASMRSEANIAALREIVKAVPHHTSADLILRAALGKAPRQLSLAGSFNIIDDSMAPFIDAIRAGRTESVADGEFAAAMQELGRVRTKLDPRAKPLHTALNDLIVFVRRHVDKEFGNVNQARAAEAEAKTLVARLDAEREKLASNAEIVEELSR